MRRTGVLLVAVALGAAALTGCSGGDEKYCGMLQDLANDNSSAEALSSDDPKAVKDLVAEFEPVEDAAPGAVQGEWETMTDGIDKYAQMLEDPAKVDKKEAERAGEAAEEAMKAVAKDAKDRCNIEINLEP